MSYVQCLPGPNKPCTTSSHIWGTVSVTQYSLPPSLAVVENIAGSRPACPPVLKSHPDTHLVRSNRPLGSFSHDSRQRITAHHAARAVMVRFLRIVGYGTSPIPKYLIQRIPTRGSFSTAGTVPQSTDAEHRRKTPPFFSQVGHQRQKPSHSIRHSPIVRRFPVQRLIHPLFMAERETLRSGYNNVDKQLATTIPTGDRTKTLRSACDYCHKAKVRCSGGGITCGRCERDNMPCHYSYPGRVGKPKGSKNKKTLEKLNALTQRASEESARGEQPHQSMPDLQPRRTAEIVDSDQITHSVLRQRSSSHDLSSPTLDSSRPTGIDASIAKYPSDLFADFPNIINTMETPSRQERQNEVTAGMLTGLFSSLEELPSPLSLFPGNEIEFDDLDFSPMHDTASCPTPRSSHSSASKVSENILDATKASEGQLAATTDENLFSSSGTFDCNCLQQQANHLCQLRDFEKRTDRLRLDNLMNLSNTVLQALEQSYKCHYCINDSQVLQITSMIFRVLLRWIAAMCQRSENIDIQFGTYNLTGDDSTWMNTLMLSRLLSKCKVNVELFKRRVDIAFSSRGSQNLDHRYLENVSTNLINTLNVYIQQLENRKAAADETDGNTSRHGNTIDQYF
ncbi:hypothetical protein K505DRAFT_355138 [Melanomma pulvis-pyrius CBS 109.77]|uniref:Zn(2)-C6 fungal-type domain-containing protein n=1 Tax=Melanomma pulvis-pyrius CBS 109.77 TaxID=1314802 RepID=A0A6A6XXR2_9PLEO|nr:hypothetical protein K505DRAFT_355138 [Melanomma pulvis-pyrius CBS 109.77]